ncbi:hypothetical protein PS2_008042 [Malus domestica]
MLPSWIGFPELTAKMGPTKSISKPQITNLNKAAQFLKPSSFSPGFNINLLFCAVQPKTTRTDEARFPRPDAPFLPRSPSWFEMMGRRVGSAYVVLYVLVCQLFVSNLGDYVSNLKSGEYTSAIGDPGMRNPNVRVALEAWNFCNEVGSEASGMGSPRLADKKGDSSPAVSARKRVVGVLPDTPGDTLQLRDKLHKTMAHIGQFVKGRT